MNPGNRMPEERRDSAEGSVFWEAECGEDIVHKQKAKPPNLKRSNTSADTG